MENYQNIALILSFVAIIVSFSSVIYTGYLSKKISSSDYKAMEKVKMDTSALIATLYSIMHKGAFSTSIKDEVDISFEKNKVSEFMLSQTGFAYHSLIYHKSKLASSEKRKGEKWRVFFMQLVELVHTESPYIAAKKAANILISFDNLTETDLKRICEFNSDLIKSIANQSKYRGENSVLKSIYDINLKEKEKHSSENLIKKFLYLKSMGINDPNIDLFIAVLDGVAEDVETALEAGADVKMTDLQLLEKYKKELKNFSESKTDNQKNSV